uniref:Uncharacterized protein n=1 Tax=Chlorobium phaeobacteroides (strain BS1) TaxID=331678 RepID=B3ELB0_CHLPB
MVSPVRQLMQPGKIRDQEASWQEAVLFMLYPALI